MTYEIFIYETRGEVGTLTYNGPKMLNANNQRSLDDFRGERQRYFGTRVIITRGAG